MCLVRQVLPTARGVPGWSPIPGTNPARWCLTSVIWREPVCHRRLAVGDCACSASVGHPGIWYKALLFAACVCFTVCTALMRPTLAETEAALSSVDVNSSCFLHGPIISNSSTYFLSFFSDSSGHYSVSSSIFFGEEFKLKLNGIFWISEELKVNWQLCVLTNKLTYSGMYAILRARVWKDRERVSEREKEGGGGGRDGERYMEAWGSAVCSNWSSTLWFLSWEVKKVRPRREWKRKT